MKTIRSHVLALVAGALSAHAAHAAPVELSFFRLSESGAPDIAAQLHLTVNPVAGQPGKIDFTLRNVVGVSSSVTDVFFAGGSILGQSTVSQSGSVFVAARGNLPGAATLDPVFSASRSFRTAVGLLNDDGTAANPGGLDRASDSVTFRFELRQGVSSEEAMAALTTAAGTLGNIRVGVIARSIDDTAANDSYVSNLLVVPIPAAAWAGVLGLAAVAGAAWIRRRAHRA